MRKLKRIATTEDGVVTVHPPVLAEEINSRQTDYLLLSPATFEKKYRHGLFQSAQIEYKDVEHEVQVNFCTNPYCRWFGMRARRDQPAAGLHASPNICLKAKSRSRHT